MQILSVFVLQDTVLIPGRIHFIEDAKDAKDSLYEILYRALGF